MQDYAATVSARAPVVRIERTERGSAEVLCIRSNVRLTFEMVFPDEERCDRFLASSRRLKDASACGGTMSVLTPSALLSTKPGTQEGKVQFMLVRTMARALGVTEAELKIARLMARSAILESYKPVMD